jgi:hypothetical protein
MLSVLDNPQNIRSHAELYSRLRTEYTNSTNIRGYYVHYLLSWKICTSIEFVKVNRSSLSLCGQCLISQFHRIYDNRNEVFI